MIIHLDFELAGILDLRKVGADVWTKDPDTGIILVGYAIDDGPVVCLDFPCTNYDSELRRAVCDGAEIHAWNAPFEWMVWNNKLASAGFPALPIERFHCTMATAANVGLPMNLGDAASAVGADFTKDAPGHRLMLRMARPRSYDANGTPRWWHVEDIQKLDDLRAYNIADVEAERAVSRHIPRMSRREREIWLVDQHMNMRGMPVDNDLLNKLHVITQDALNRLNREVADITKGNVTSLSQHSRLINWLREHGFPRDMTLDKNSTAEFVGSTGFHQMDADAQRVLILRREAAKTSTAKLKSIAAYSQGDRRARNLVQYGGAVRTLRWAGRGPQIQNFPRPMPGLRANDAIDQILLGLDAEGIGLIYGRPLDVVSSCLRGVFKAPVGFKFVICDFSAIEAVVLAWLADFTALLDVFRRKEDVYVFTASAIGSTDRQLGKVLRLACGYGMGGPKFQTTAATFGLELTWSQAGSAVAAFRSSNTPIVSLWHRYEHAAKQAIGHPGQSFKAGHVAFRMANPEKLAKGSLLIEKPGGGYLVYRDAHIDNSDVCYWGVDQYTRKWSRIRTYGGKLCLAGDTLVLTERGWLRLDHITNERVWDGESFVEHRGLLAKGLCPVVALDGIRVTPDHEILTTRGWRRASSCEGFDRAPVALPDGAPICGSGWQEIVLGRHGSDVSAGTHSRAGGQHGRVFGGELRLGDIQGSGQQPTQQVYDLVDAGPRHRFVVAGRDGPLIVHNCENVTQAIARDLLAEVMVRLESAVPGALVATVHDEIVALPATEDAFHLLGHLKTWMSTPPDWAKGMPLSAAGYVSERYTKG